jgi:deoxycytidine triphosphate deaminase
MAIKSDRWIRKMALEHDMINPFNDRQVRDGVIPTKIYSNEGLCQILFFQGDEACEVSYKDKSGKYQRQSGIVLPKL